MKQLKPYNPPAFIKGFIDEGMNIKKDFETLMKHYHLSVQPELTRKQEKELKNIEDKIFYLTTKLQIEKLNNCI